jgi:hypothetical protein
MKTESINIRVYPLLKRMLKDLQENYIKGDKKVILSQSKIIEIALLELSKKVL